MNMPSLKPGDKIGFIATARKVSKEELSPCVALLESWGLRVVLSPNLFSIDDQFAGTDKERTADLQWAIDHPELKAVIVARGGYGTSKIIDQVSFSAFKKNPKWFVGFSDVTVLLSSLANHKIPSIHGPVGLLLPKHEGKESADRLKEILFYGTGKDINSLPHKLNKMGEATGELVGGNLSILHTILATPSDINTDGNILFIEDLDEYLYHIDRMMVHLDRAGKLKNLAGLIVGHMSDMNDNAIPFGKTAHEIIHEHCSAYNYPIVFGMPIGHENDNHPLLVSRAYSLEVNEVGGRLSVLKDINGIINEV